MTIEKLPERLPVSSLDTTCAVGQFICNGMPTIGFTDALSPPQVRLETKFHNEWIEQFPINTHGDYNMKAKAHIKMPL